MMRRLFLFFLCLTAVTRLIAAGGIQDDERQKKFPGGKCFLYRVQLSDKNGTPYRLDRAEEFLSSKSIERRRRQRLAIDSTDLPVNPHYIQRVISDKVTLIGQSKWNNTLLVKVRDAKDVKALRSLPFVKEVIKVWTSPDSVKPTVRTLFHKELNKWETAPEDEYGFAGANIDLVKGRSLHQMGCRGKGMTIAVFDGGFMNVDRIPAMKNVKIVGTRDFLSFPSTDIYKEADHGTKVLSAMALNMPGTYIGTAPDAEFWLMRTEDVQTESLAEEDYWTFAAEFADSLGVDIISSSLGFQDFDDKTTDHQYVELDGEHALISRTASMLSAKGIVLVNSAGNEGVGTWKKINFPADAKDILAVGAVNKSKKNATFSSVGPTQDGRVKPDIMALGSPASVMSGRGMINSDMGTSFAAPIISGLVACLWQSAPLKTATQVMEAVRRSSDNYATPNNVFGYGIPDFEKAVELLKMKDKNER